MTYRAVSPLKPYEQPNEYTSSGSTIHGYGGGRSFRSYENSRSKKASFIGQKSGFGSAGARSSAS